MPYVLVTTYVETDERPEAPDVETCPTREEAKAIAEMGFRAECGLERRPIEWQTKVVHWHHGAKPVDVLHFECDYIWVVWSIHEVAS